MKSNSLRERNGKFISLKKALILMKMVFLVLLAGLQFVFANTLAQQITLNFKNAKLEDVFKSIAAQSQYKFLYNDDVLAKVPRVSVVVKDAPLEDVLKKLVAEHGFDYKIMANTILVSLPTSNTSVTALQTRASGIVLDDKGAPLSNASVIVVGTSHATMTDREGKFQIQASVGNTLEVRHVGFKTARITISNLNNIRIALSPEEASIEEVQVVATGYQNLDRKLFTGAATKVNA